ncbi:hypothetical protein [Bradyrhizobium sp. 25ACV]
MSDFSLDFPADFADYEWQLEAKGWFSQSLLIVAGKRYRLNFYDPVRLRQEIEDMLAKGEAFFEPNLVVVRSVTRASMEGAAAQLAQSSTLALLLEE